MSIDIDIIIPCYNSKVLAECSVGSFEKNKKDFNFRYIIVENANDDSYKNDILKISPNVLWIKNHSKNTINNNKHAWGNAEGIEIGLKNSSSEYVFMCHNDVAAVHPDWMKILYDKAKIGYKMVGTRFDNPESERIGALHISGLLIERNLALKVPSIYPEWDKDSKTWKLDVGDAYTRYCRENNIKYYCFRNTHNKNINFPLQEPYGQMTYDRVVDDDGNVFYMHLGRGSLKQSLKYYKKNNFNDWASFIKNKIILGDEHV